MRIAVDFDGTIVDDSHAYDDLQTPLAFKPGAREGLYALKAAGHHLLLWSARSSRAGLYDPRLDPLVRAGVAFPKEDNWQKSRALNLARLHQMLDFVAAELPGLFDAIDDGIGGKPYVDLFIDDKALAYGQTGWSWAEIADIWGEAPRAITKESEDDGT